MRSTVDECDGSSDVTRYEIINDHVVYDDEFICDTTADEDQVDAQFRSIDDDRDYEELVLSLPVRLSLVWLLQKFFFSQY